MNVLEPTEAEKKLKRLDVEWAIISNNTLQRIYTFEDFSHALAFVNKVGKIAEDHAHHPDIQLSWGKVIVSITTHSAGGLTDADFKLAKALD